MTPSTKWPGHDPFLANYIFKKDMIESYQKGLTTELYAQQAFIKRGYMVSVPIGACKYDLIADINGSLYKI